MGDLLGFVESSCVYLDDDLTRNNVAWFLMGDFLKLSPWSGGLG